MWRSEARPRDWKTLHVVNSDWQPLDAGPGYVSAFHEGIPTWASRQVWSWVSARTRARGSGSLGPGLWDAAFVEEFEQRRRIARLVSPKFSLLGPTSLKVWDDSLVLAFIDFLLADGPQDGEASDEVLERVLDRSGSAWRVGARGGYRGLERRVQMGVLDGAERALATPGHAGARLSEAWHAVYGVSANPTHAYAMAVKAVEDAAIPVVVPKQAGATLGHVIGRLRDDGDWALPLTREDPGAQTAGTVLGLCQALWKGHHDRHGGDPGAPQSVGQVEAEAAVQIAVFLVHGFATGMIARR